MSETAKMLHVNLAPGEAGRYAIVPGDPDRCELIAAHLDNPRMVTRKREFTTWEGTLDGERVTVTSTGIGGPSTAICVEELHKCGADTFIRVGTCASTCADVQCGDIVVVSGSSMNNTLTDGDRLLVQSTFYTPQRGDVVVVDSYINYGKPLVKRVIAKGGDTVDIDVEQGLVYVNGEALDEPYVPEGTLSTGNVEFPLTVPEGTLFLMGDNRQHSTDSRSSDVGFIDERDILGKVVLRIYPFNKIGLIQ